MPTAANSRKSGASPDLRPRTLEIAQGPPTAGVTLHEVLGNFAETNICKSCQVSEFSLATQQRSVTHTFSRIVAHKNNLIDELHSRNCKAESSTHDEPGTLFYNSHYLGTLTIKSNIRAVGYQLALLLIGSFDFLLLCAYRGGRSDNKKIKITKSQGIFSKVWHNFVVREREQDSLVSLRSWYVRYSEKRGSFD